MALIKCDYCGKDISDRAKACIHCGQKIKKQDTNTSSINISIPNTKISDNININKLNYTLDVNREFVKVIVDIVGCVILLLLLFNMGSIHTSKSGTYSLFKLIDWILVNSIGFNITIGSISSYTTLAILMFIYIGVCLALFELKNQTLKNIGKAGFILIAVFEVLCMIFLEKSRWNINANYYIIFLYTIALIVWLFVSRKEKAVIIDTKPVVKEKKKEIVNNDIEELEPVSQNKEDISSLDSIKKLKELLDMNAITKAEYDEMKKAILKKEKEKILK